LKLTDELSDSLEELEDEQLDAQLQLLARLLREDRLHIKVAVPRESSWRIFHPKMGIFHDDAGNAISFEGSVNETVGGWKNNYERFKIHRSWVDQQSAYVDSDVDTFRRLWEDDHPYVKVHDLPEAIIQDLIDWKDPDSQTQLEEAIQIARGEAPPPNAIRPISLPTATSRRGSCPCRRGEYHYPMATPACRLGYARQYLPEQLLAL